MEKIFLIQRLWVDPLENEFSAAFGYDSVGVVYGKEEADRICGLATISKSMYPWPLKHVNGVENDSVPMFYARELKILNGLSLEELEEKE